MKKIIFETAPVPDNFIDAITDNSFVGIQFETDGEKEKVFVARDSEGDYVGISKGEDTESKLWSAKTKRGYVIESVNVLAGEAFLFDSEVSLLKWILE